MADIAKLSTLLDDPEIRDLLYGLAHIGPRTVPPGPARLRSVVLRLSETTTPSQYASWLSDAARNERMTVDQVRLAVGEATLDDLAQFSGASPGAVAWQLAGVLPDLVDAISPGGRVVAVELFATEIVDAITAGDRSAGAFGY